MQTLFVSKLDLQGNETYRYTGRLLERRGNLLVLEAFFDRGDTQVDEIVLRRGDRFVEYYFYDRWYNIFQIFDREDQQLKGWYCNISRPAAMRGNTIVFQDLALDLLVYPDGRQVVLDEDEFQSLPLSSALREQAQNALRELQALFAGADGLPPWSQAA
jgi:predicted RNA-binding protein associated with RNAse of E/G family